MSNRSKNDTWTEKELKDSIRSGHKTRHKDKSGGKTEIVSSKSSSKNVETIYSEKSLRKERHGKHADNVEESVSATKERRKTRHTEEDRNNPTNRHDKVRDGLAERPKHRGGDMLDAFPATGGATRHHRNTEDGGERKKHRDRKSHEERGSHDNRREGEDAGKHRGGNDGVERSKHRVRNEGETRSKHSNRDYVEEKGSRRYDGGEKRGHRTRVVSEERQYTGDDDLGSRHDNRGDDRHDAGKSHGSSKTSSRRHRSKETEEPQYDRKNDGFDRGSKDRRHRRRNDETEEERRIRKQKKHSRRERERDQRGELGHSTVPREGAQGSNDSDEVVVASRSKKKDLGKDSDEDDNDTDSNQEPVANDNYDDDEFEDYDDDFEDDEGDADGSSDRSSGPELTGNPEMDAVILAMRHENKVAAKERDDSNVKRDAASSKMIADDLNDGFMAYTGSIDFSKARQSAQKRQPRFRSKRHADLSNMIELDRVTFDLFEKKPLGEYDLYIRSYGRSNTSQVSMQCNDDNMEREVQTEDPEVADSWSQFPAYDDNHCSGGTNVTNQVYKTTSTSTLLDSNRFTDFLQNATPVVLALLEELSSASSKRRESRQTSLPISDSCVELNTEDIAFTKDRPIMAANFCPMENQNLVVAYGYADLDPASGGLLCVWNTNIPAEPQKLLFCKSEPTCCCFPAHTASLVFAGTADGSILVWDLREDASMHSRQGNWLLRNPTYNTAPMSSNKPSSPVISMTSVFASAKVPQVDSTNSFQVACLEANSTITFWVVIEVAKPDWSGLDTDLGMLPGGRIKLVPSSSITLDYPGSTCMCLSSRDPNFLYVGDEKGGVVRKARYGGKSYPNFHEPEVNPMCTMTALSYSLFHDLLLAANWSGAVYIYTNQRAQPLLSCSGSTNGHPILDAQWSTSRPSVFFVLDGDSNLFIWDLFYSTSVPQTVHHLDKRLIMIRQTNNHSALKLGVAGRRAEFGLFYEDGSLEVHQVKRDLRKFKPDDVTHISDLVMAM